MHKPDTTWVAITFLATGAFLLGWWTFWFQCDDAYITFRYALQRQAGFGYVFNRPPFSPIEGYTSFLWLVLLDAISSLGAPIHRIANPILLGFALVGLWSTAWAMQQTALAGAYARHRDAWTAWGLFTLVTHRTVLAWASSGLETSLFVALLLGWTWTAALTDLRAPGRTARLVQLATLLTLTRPDGLLFLAATAGIVGATPASWARRARDAAWALPVVAHLLWRHHTYGDWLPNTYRAKVDFWWWDAGLRYLGAFVLEHAYWVVLPALAVGLWRRPRPAPGPALAGAALAAHTAFYTLRVGGDHFEYRVFAHLPYLLAVFGPPLLQAAGLRLRHAAALAAAQALFALPIPWGHWAVTHEMNTRAATLHLAVPLAPYAPPGLSAYVAAWDELQAWLLARSIGTRHQEHKMFGAQLTWLFEPPTPDPTRPFADGGRYLTTADGMVDPRQSPARALAALPTHAAGPIGALGWAMPEVAIIDMLGLNDRYVATLPPTPPGPGAPLQMAHFRNAPQEYVACYQPNASVHVVDVAPDGALRFLDGLPLDAVDAEAGPSLAPGHRLRSAVVLRERAPLTPEAIARCERR